MPSSNHSQGGELQELRHEAQPGYRTVFWVVLGVMSLVLVIAILMGADVSTHH